VSSREGEIALWIANGLTAETKISGIEVKKGDAIDFVVDGRKDPEADVFGWAPVVKSLESNGPTWSASSDFRGPSAERLTNWDRYAQVLLETNEFAFVD
jgi:hypothetical protein